MSRKRINDTRIINALIQTDNIRKASELCKVSQATIYNRFHDSEFMELLQAERMKILNYATFRIQVLLNEQIEILSGIAKDESNPPQVRTSASDKLMKYGLQLTEQQDILERLRRIEEQLEVNQ